jgi:hypothetical protein
MLFHVLTFPIHDSSQVWTIRVIWVEEETTVEAEAATVEVEAAAVALTGADTMLEVERLLHVLERITMNKL